MRTIVRNPERLRRVKNLKRCHEIKTTASHWARVVTVEADQNDRDYMRIRLQGFAAPIRWRKARLVTSRLATTVPTSLTERDYALLNQLMPAIVAGWRNADDLTLQHEAERLDSLPNSPVIRSMRQLVDAERASRTAKAGIR